MVGSALPTTVIAPASEGADGLTGEPGIQSWVEGFSLGSSGRSEGQAALRPFRVHRQDRYALCCPRRSGLIGGVDHEAQRGRVGDKRDTARSAGA